MTTLGSLFSGIGGLELGLERATGARTIWNCEQDEFCRKILAKHWPEATQYEDVRSIDETVERVDLLCGGFPCQNLSVAGDRTGLAGEKSGLWHEYARIIRLLRPRLVFVENVPALRTLVSDNGLGRVLGDLAESGYDTEWDCVPAAAVGAPHVRDRIFILAWQRDMASLRSKLADTNSQVGRSEEGVPESEDSPRTDGRGASQLGRRGGAVPGSESELADAPGRGRRPRPRGGVGAGTSSEQGHVARQAGAPSGTLAHAHGAGREERRGAGSVQTQQQAAQRAGGHLPGGLFADFPPRPGAEEWGDWLTAHPSAQPGIRRDPDGVRGPVDRDRRKRLKALGNAVVPQAAAQAWHILSARAGVLL